MLFAFSTDLYSIRYLILDRMEKERRFWIENCLQKYE